MADPRLSAIKLSVFKRAFSKDIKIIRFSFAIFLVVILVLLFHYVQGQIEDSGLTLKNNFDKRDSIIEQTINSISDTSNLMQIKKLKEQYQVINEIKGSYLYMAGHFNSYGYAFTLFFAITSIGTAILAFLLLKKGWDDTKSYYLKVSFMILFFFSTFFGILPNVFNNKENAGKNLIKYTYFSGLQVDIYDLVSDNKRFIRSGHSDTLDFYISNINTGIKENQDLYFDIFIDKIPKEIKPPLGN